jgi:FkbM family methyltransferase
VSSHGTHAQRRPISRFLPRSARSLLDRPGVNERVVSILRGRTVHESSRFAARELAGARTTHIYRLRDSGLKAQLEHGTPDVHALDQAFYAHSHEPPPRAAAALEGRGHQLRAVDVGAHIGMWGLWLHGRFPVEHLVALEPDPRNVACHRRQIEINGLRHRWQVMEAAAVTADGPVSFTKGRGTNGQVTDAAAVGAAAVAGVDVFGLLDDVDLLKIDIEGGEWAILADPRARALSVPVVMLEHHADNAPSADPAGDAKRALEQAGYITEAAEETQPGYGVVWGWKPFERSWSDADERDSGEAADAGRVTSGAQASRRTGSSASP